MEDLEGKQMRRGVESVVVTIKHVIKILFNRCIILFCGILLYNIYYYYFVINVILKKIKYT